MAYQGIGTGSTPNDNTGDSLFTGAIKINSNFKEIYNALGDGSSIGRFTATTPDSAGTTGGVIIRADSANKSRIQFTNSTGSNQYGYLESTQDNLFWSGNQRISGILTATTYVGNGVIPIGGIIMWSGTIAQLSTNPQLSNWRLCDGTNNTPDLRSRFIVGATSDASTGVTFNADTGAVSGSYAPGNTGGEVAHQLTVAEMPSHAHLLSRISANSNVNIQSSSYALACNNNLGFDITQAAGSSDYHENRPPYYALAFIMRVA